MRPTRRTLLTAGCVAVLAGCLDAGDDDSEGEAADHDDSAESDEEAETTADREDSASGELTAPVWGDPDADVTMEVYEDFSCPACQQFKLEIFPAIADQYLESETIRYEHRDYPLPVDDWSEPVANAARAVQDLEGDEAFFAFVSDVYAHQGAYSYDRLESVADNLGYDGEAVRDAAEAGTYQATLEADIARGEELGVTGTPNVFVNGSQVEFEEGTPAMETINEAIDAASQ